MKRYLLLAPLALCLANNGSCNFNASATRACAVTQDVLAFMVQNHVELGVATKISNAVAIGQAGTAAVCAAIEAANPPVVQP